MYSSATFKIQSNGRTTKNFNVAEGVLQGEILSPLLFILFISDLEDFFRDNGSIDINIDGKCDILSLLYADDLALLAHTKADLQKKLNLLTQYCQSNKLAVNVGKTKIIYCRCAGRLPRDLNFRFGDQKIEITDNYEYLGLTVSASGFSRPTAINAINKARSALSSVSGIIFSTKTDSVPCIIKLFDSIVQATLLYASPIWALSNLDLIEKIQCEFFKRVFGLPKTTAGALLRVELGRPRLAYFVLKATWDWICKILAMDDKRLPKICLKRISSLSQAAQSKAKFNWLCHLLEIIKKYYPDIVPRLEKLDLPTWCSYRDTFLRRYQNQTWWEDMRLASNAHYLQTPYTNDNPRGCCKYLSKRMKLNATRLFMQLKLASKFYFAFKTSGCCYELHYHSKCPICNTKENDTIEHFMTDCPVLAHLRQQYLINTGSAPPAIHDALKNPDMQTIKALSLFIPQACRLRAFILNE
ncbi:uncharacterized protein LOC124297043 [Neodiprion virginianus]|uniref:uncharacterized protein LOC124297043 n=1 Tax=Neodiprion virginianus TaxID=2961670 RepID=UPI001EE72B79|nr:uncharacterized protein LOC124297043 [Neodiprion virginianus]